MSLNYFLHTDIFFNRYNVDFRLRVYHFSKFVNEKFV